MSKFLLRAAAIVAAGLAATFALSTAPATATTGTAALAVSLTPGTGTLVQGTPTRFVISVTNRGPNAAPAANLRLYLGQDPNTFHLALPTTMKLDRSPYVANWAIGNLAVGQTASTSFLIIGQRRTGSTPDVVQGFMELLATSKAGNPLLIRDGAGDVYSTSRKFVTVAPINHSPFGSLDRVTVVGRSVRVQGWAADPDDLFLPLPISLANNGVRHPGVTHPVARPDVAQARGTGPKPGFDVSLTLPPGRHSICTYAANAGGGFSTDLGCRTVTIG